ncbi:hypothetical protein EMIHUDRAFT_455939 [Emiliania huxleyi CCMP1516]|uniref:BLOC-1-related complex subunit 7 n=2 Tax=Emiliania huxleyi TaxID=2903 RepID=A0A0D3KAU9_EMIH1|nr:hypothetical protein EMIHUDRAFT_456437 [Emiliania huxleyi CCMP1516]XP_005785313.1 hypothetical protein EMIHUDRAFT_455939 [Emiliania huxleyi CCMP1516]EOD30765.1 hypothetical protein EMIHUDRAFT_456437 [Emiliania huxleyi CCMP1516]EOD32884.1 hypothetical protein EMIHUDRAFT_455939 [Emiliania huxleyi CCMP1516]|eukprot:XP_005783194.1 hypothetical protein EMIHUDRAFT_456437 [Emiliania huxleyi CCMP1516]
MPPYPQPDSEALTRAVANAMAAAAEVAAGNNDALRRAIRELGDRVDGIGSRVDGLSGEVKSCRAALVLSQEESERRLSAGQREAAETTCETMLSGVQRMLDELRRALAAEKPPQPPPKPSVADRGVQAGGRERAVQAGGVDDSTQHDPLLEDGACQTDAPPSARPLVVPLALTVPASVSRAVSPPRPRKPADIYWYHQVHSAPPGSVQGRYVRQ